MDQSKIKNKFHVHKASAKVKNIPFQLSFTDWYEWWLNTGHWDERGRGRGKYHMCRFNDTGPYAIGNIYYDTHENNLKTAHIGREVSPHTRQLLSIHNTGKYVSIETREKQSIAHRKIL